MQWWATAAKRNRTICDAMYLWLRGRNCKPIHREAISAMGIEELDAAHVIVTDERGNAREGYVEPHRFGKLGCKESKLFFAAITGLSLDENTRDARRRRMSLQIEVQQLEQNLTFRDRQRRLDDALVLAAAIQAQPYRNAGQSKGTIAGAGEKLIQHGAKYKEQRVHHFDRRIEGDEAQRGKRAALREP